MKSIIFTALSLILIFSFNACSQQIHRDNAVLLDIANSCDFFDEFPDIHTLSFDKESNGDIPGAITRMNIINDTIYVLDPYKSKAFFAFDKDGNKLFDYSKIGQGEEEYLFLRDFYCTDRYIYLLDSDSHKILVLDKSGIYQTKIDVPAHIAHILPLPSSKTPEFIFDMYSNEKARLLKSKGGRVSDTLMLNPDGLGSFLYLPLQVFQPSNMEDYEWLYMPSYSSIVYKLSNTGNIEDYMAIDFNGLLPDIEIFKSLKGLKYKEKERKIREYAYDYGFFISNGNIIISFFYEDRLYLNFINTELKQVKTFNLSSNYYPVLYSDGKIYFITSDNDDITVVNVSTLNTNIQSI
ncbi:6-bladed beta-propeller [uncultured Duncaniella sp.]|uniref:6-bladed beta-propeller n=1 Tax=uncultured Duncaniella sp. TaxID=2768039 RepID=UPI0025E0BC89|nr:6-bladed beta-propeller [uncultured Duncaniella sp.]